MVQAENGLRIFLREQLPLVDEIFSDSRMPIHKRPFEAANFIVEHCIIEMKGAKKEQPYFMQEWFKGIYDECQSWYREKYTDALSVPNDDLTSFCVLSGIAFSVEIPKTTKRVIEDGESIWLEFPILVKDDESPLSWIKNGPVLTKFTPSEIEKCTGEIRERAMRLRSLYSSLMTLKGDDEIMALRESLIHHLESASQKIVEASSTFSDKAILGMSCWESHQAAEKAMKILTKQEAGSFPATHSLDVLLKEIRNPKIHQLNLGLFKKMPSGKAVVSMRYGGSDVSFERAVEVYETALELTASVADLFSRDLYMRGAAFQLKRLPFHNKFRET